MDNSNNRDNYIKATEILKKVLPLLVKNHIPATPNHYNLWFNYVSKLNLDLVKEINEIIGTVGFCSEIKSEMLYDKFIATEVEKELSSVKKSIEKMVSEISSSISDTYRGTENFQSKLNTSFGKLKEAEDGRMSIEDTMQVIREMVKNSSEVVKDINIFSSQLKRADKEINYLKQQIVEIQKEVNTDGLTNLLNRRAFDIDIGALVSTQRQFSVIIGDIDKFKVINDTYGHLMGDTALKAVAHIFNTNCRNGATAYRYGGEEFVMLIPNTTLSTARQIADSMRRRVEKLNVMSKDTGIKLNSITASFGVSEFNVNDSVTTVIDRADKLLYEAKRLGRNRVMPISF